MTTPDPNPNPQPHEPASQSRVTADSVTPVRLWVAGARPKTLGAAIAPVVVGTAAATIDGPMRWARAIAALVVAIALQVGVNFANDYSDGVRGTDKDRRGPIRLVASGLASPRAVRNASAISFGIAAIVGGVLSLVVNPWLILVGVAALVAAVTYTRRAEAVRLPRPGRTDGARVLRFRGDGRQRVRASTAASRAWRGGAHSPSACPRVPCSA